MALVDADRNELRLHVVEHWKLFIKRTHRLPIHGQSLTVLLRLTFGSFFIKQTLSFLIEISGVIKCKPTTLLWSHLSLYTTPTLLIVRVSILEYSFLDYYDLLVVGRRRVFVGEAGTKTHPHFLPKCVSVLNGGSFCRLLVFLLLHQSKLLCIELSKIVIVTAFKYIFD